MYQVYTQLFNRDKYNTLKHAVAGFLGVTQTDNDELTDIMNDILDRAIGYAYGSFMAYNNTKTVHIVYSNDVYEAYIDFMRPFVTHYQAQQN